MPDPNMVYRVRGWEQHFENDRSRARDRCGYVAVPNKNGKGKQILLSEPDGVQIFGWFILVCEELSRQRKPRHGWCAGEGLPSDSPWSDAEWGVATRCPISFTDRAISVLIRPEIGWMVVTHRPVTAESPSDGESLTRTGQDRTREDRRREDRTGQETPAEKSAGVNNSVRGISAKKLVHEDGWKIAIRLFGSIFSAEKVLEEAVRNGQDLTRVLAWLLVVDADHQRGEVKNTGAYYRALWSKGSEPPEWALERAKEMRARQTQEAPR